MTNDDTTSLWGHSAVFDLSTYEPRGAKTLAVYPLFVSSPDPHTWQLRANAAVRVFCIAQAEKLERLLKLDDLTLLRDCKELNEVSTAIQKVFSRFGCGTAGERAAQQQKHYQVALTFVRTWSQQRREWLEQLTKMLRSLAEEPMDSTNQHAIQDLLGTVPMVARL